MGIFQLSIGVGDTERSRFESVDVLVDTRATYAVLPRRLLEELGVVPHTRAPFVVADGREIELEIGRAWIRIDGREEYSLVVFGDRALLGAVTLEEFRLAPIRWGEGSSRCPRCSCAWPPEQLSID